jgi:hypothetical protein
MGDYSWRNRLSRWLPRLLLVAAMLVFLATLSLSCADTGALLISSQNGRCYNLDVGESALVFRVISQWPSDDPMRYFTYNFGAEIDGHPGPHQGPGRTASVGCLTWGDWRVAGSADGTIRLAPPFRRPLVILQKPYWEITGRYDYLLVGSGLIILVPLFRAGRAVLLGRRRTIRMRAGRCVGCNYDLRASPGRCPECGTIQGEI